MAERYDGVEDILRSRRPQLPAYCTYPHVYHDTAGHFVDGFPGRVLYALKANDHPTVIKSLHANLVSGIYWADGCRITKTIGSKYGRKQARWALDRAR